MLLSEQFVLLDYFCYLLGQLAGDELEGLLVVLDLVELGSELFGGGGCSESEVVEGGSVVLGLDCELGLVYGLEVLQLVGYFEYLLLFGLLQLSELVGAGEQLLFEIVNFVFESLVCE